jgi:hypothetical protein
MNQIQASRAALRVTKAAVARACAAVIAAAPHRSPRQRVSPGRGTLPDDPVTLALHDPHRLLEPVET